MHIEEVRGIYITAFAITLGDNYITVQQELKPFLFSPMTYLTIPISLFKSKIFNIIFLIYLATIFTAIILQKQLQYTALCFPLYGMPAMGTST